VNECRLLTKSLKILRGMNGDGYRNRKVNMTELKDLHWIQWNQILIIWRRMKLVTEPH